LNNAVGFLGLSVLGGVAAFLTFYLISKPFKLAYWKVAGLGFFFVQLSEAGIREGLRSQVIANLLLAVHLWILIKARQNRKALIPLPFLFLIWANFHGTVILGLGVMTIFFASYYLIDKKNLVFYLTIGLATTSATLINPFGYNIYIEAFKHFTSEDLEYVLEWQPIGLDCPYCHQVTFYFYAGLLAYAFIAKKSIHTLPYIILSVALFYPTINARRYLPIFAVVTLPALGIWLEDLKLDLEKFKLTPYLTVIVLMAGTMYNLLARYVDYGLYTYSESKYCYHASGCSPAMADYLIKHPLKGKGFNFYDWGGYYIGKGIPEKLFIDGRMHLWSQNGYSPFVDFIAMYYFQYDDLFRRYAFDWVLLPLNSDIGREIYHSDDLGKWKIEFRDGDVILFTKR